MALAEHTILTRCPVCSGGNHVSWHQKNGYDVVRCSECDFVFAKEIPSADFLRRYYESAYIDEAGEFHPRGGFGRRVKYRLFAWWIKRFLSKTMPIRTLELGCGQGDLLWTFHTDARFQAQGVDFAEAPLGYARSRGLSVSKGDIHTLNLPGGSVDLVVAVHFLEHVGNLPETVEEVHRVLRDGGLFFAVCPCVTHIKARLAGVQWKYLVPPAHLWYFSPATISRFLGNAGFEILTASCLYHRAHIRVLAAKSKPSDPP